MGHNIIISSASWGTYNGTRSTCMGVSSLTCQVTRNKVLLPVQISNTCSLYLLHNHLQEKSQHGTKRLYQKTHYPLTLAITLPCLHVTWRGIWRNHTQASCNTCIEEPMRLGVSKEPTLYYPSPQATPISVYLSQVWLTGTLSGCFSLIFADSADLTSSI